MVFGQRDRPAAALHREEHAVAAAVRRGGRMDHNAPVGRRILGLLEDERRIGLVHADFDRGAAFAIRLPRGSLE